MAQKSKHDLALPVIALILAASVAATLASTVALNPEEPEWNFLSGREEYRSKMSVGAGADALHPAALGHLVRFCLFYSLKLLLQLCSCLAAVRVLSFFKYGLTVYWEHKTETYTILGNVLQNVSHLSKTHQLGSDPKRNIICMGAYPALPGNDLMPHSVDEATSGNPRDRDLYRLLRTLKKRSGPGRFGNYAFGRFWPKGRLSSFLLPEPIQGPKNNPMPMPDGNTFILRIRRSDLPTEVAPQNVMLKPWPKIRLPPRESRARDVPLHFNLVLPHQQAKAS